jgi:phage baseplate assembly protein W
MDRAFRFVHPDLDRDDDPGLHVSPTGGLALVAGDAAVRQAILLLLSTRPGERVMRPLYGCNLHRILFWPNDNTTAGLAIHYVRQAIERWEPRVQIVRIDAERNAIDAARLDVRLEYRVRSTQSVDELNVSIPLNGDDEEENADADRRAETR